jgi:small subunit ribosomal protein S30e
VFAGKVHGSLARAGKVRGQTPKVPKQDKKKKPKGRAMKRIKYNRRFVNVGECTLHSVDALDLRWATVGAGVWSEDFRCILANSKS